MYDASYRFISFIIHTVFLFIILLQRNGKRDSHLPNGNVFPHAFFTAVLGAEETASDSKVQRLIMEKCANAMALIYLIKTL